MFLLCSPQSKHLGQLRCTGARPFPSPGSPRCARPTARAPPSCGAPPCRRRACTSSGAAPRR
eukprot:6303363-Prymnesium_polylepis.1